MLEPDGRRLRHGGGRQAGARRHADRRRRRDPRPRQGGGRRRQQAIKVKKIMIVNKDTVDGLIKQGL